jgi:hypothetical protein
MWVCEPISISFPQSVQGYVPAETWLPAGTGLAMVLLSVCRERVLVPREGRLNAHSWVAREGAGSLYSLPPGQFTAARRDLARAYGQSGEGDEANRSNELASPPSRRGR